MNFKDFEIVYENIEYAVIRQDYMTKDNEELNWAIVNKEHNTVEHRQACLPVAIDVADNLEKGMQLIKQESDAREQERKKEEAKSNIKLLN